MADNETHEAVVKLARRELEDHERINCWFRPEFVRALIDRLEAAHKRDIEDAERRGNHAAMKAVCETIEKVGPLYDAESIGNAAKMREALSAALDMIFDLQNCHRSPIANSVYAVRRKIKDALAAPPRNCDLPKVVEDPWRAWLDDKSNWDEFGSPKLEIHEWLLAPATEKEGGDKCIALYCPTCGKITDHRLQPSSRCPVPGVMELVCVPCGTYVSFRASNTSNKDECMTLALKAYEETKMFWKEGGNNADE